MGSACSSRSGGAADESQLRPALRRAPEVAAFLESLKSLPVAPAAEGIEAVPPQGGFDCPALARTYLTSVANPAQLFAEASSESAPVQDLISTAQINIADGIAACERGDHAAAADYLSGAAYAAALIEDTE